MTRFDRSITRAAAAAVAIAASAPGCNLLDPNPDGTVREFTAVAYGDGRYVAVGVSFRRANDAVVPTSDTTLIATSDDGRNWREAPLRVPGTLANVTWGNGRFVAVGTFVDPNGPDGHQESTPVVVVSTDGASWSRASELPDVRWGTVTFGNGRFLATGFDPGPLVSSVFVSDDGMTWATTTESGILGAEATFGNGTFLLWGEDRRIALSTDGTSWEVVDVDSIVGVRDIAYLDGRFIGNGDHDCCFREVPGARRIYTLESPDGRAWVVRPQGLGEVLSSHAFGNGRFVAAAGREIALAGGRLDWSIAAEFRDYINDVAFADGLFLAAGRGLWVSDDGIGWQRVE